MTKPVRLQRYLAQAGLGARRGCEELIREQRVIISGRVAKLGDCVVPGRDRVEVDGREVVVVAERVVILLNKPAGALSACRRGHEKGRLVTEYVKSRYRLFPCGRLDRDSEGLLILTNDGDLALQLTHPRFAKEKEYEVDLTGSCSEEQAASLTKGVELSDGPARAVRVKRLSPRRLRVVLAEGRKRQLRRMLSRLGLGLRRLVRVRVGGLELGGLKPGRWRTLTESEVRALVQPQSKRGQA